MSQNQEGNILNQRQILKQNHLGPMPSHTRSIHKAEETSQNTFGEKRVCNYL